MNSAAFVLACWGNGTMVDHGPLLSSYTQKVVTSLDAFERPMLSSPVWPWKVDPWVGLFAHHGHGALPPNRVEQQVAALMAGLGQECNQPSHAWPEGGALLVAAWTSGRGMPLPKMISAMAFYKDGGANGPVGEALWLPAFLEWKPGMTAKDRWEASTAVLSQELERQLETMTPSIPRWRAHLKGQLFCENWPTPSLSSTSPRL